jgi:hypothetical protein
MITVTCRTPHEKCPNQADLMVVQGCDNQHISELALCRHHRFSVSLPCRCGKLIIMGIEVPMEHVTEKAKGQYIVYTAEEHAKEQRDLLRRLSGVA